MNQPIRERTRPGTAFAPAAPLQPAARARSRNIGAVRVLPFSSEVRSANLHPLQQVLRQFESKQIEDPFQKTYGASGGSSINTILTPPLSIEALMRLPNESNALRQCIDAMVVNIEGFGYRMDYIGPEGQMDSPEAKAEKLRCTSLLDNPNGEYGIIELRERVRRDIETIGMGYIEAPRTRTGEIAMLYHTPGATIRLTGKDMEETEVTQILIRDGVETQVKIKRRFRRYVQMSGAQRVYFKEFGDPRKIDPKTGKVNDQLAFEDSATELIMLHLYTPGQVYGLPRWACQMPSILGSRESEVTNLNFFRDNAIPALAVLVSGGQLSEDAVIAIQNLIDSGMGREAQHRVLVLEAQGDQQGASVEGAVPSPKIEIKSLQNERQTDALFQTYDQNNQKKVRGAFRLPPLLVGFSDDLTYASAETSMLLVESQVFGPERKKVDDMFDQFILRVNGRPLKYWAFRSNPPRIASPTVIAEAITKLDAAGALTPNVTIALANELFGLKIQPVDEDWGDYPMAMIIELTKLQTLKGIEPITQPAPPKPVDPNAKPAPAAAAAPAGKGKAKPAATPAPATPAAPAPAATAKPVPANTQAAAA